MAEILWDWLICNWVEITGAILGIIYVLLSIKQKILTWLLGLLSSVLYIYVFFDSGFYADMALQFYYVWISIFGWIIWTRGNETETGKKKIPVSRTSHRLFIRLIFISALLWLFVWVILKQFTDSVIPIGDSFTTALSIVATWMLARKKIEHWIVWVVVDMVSMLLYLWKGLYPTFILFGILTFAAIWGYFEWKKHLLNENYEQ
jgi:nicotinamide mononucleotide transporter